MAFTMSKMIKLMGPTWGTSGPCRPQMGPMNLAIRVFYGYNFIGELRKKTEMDPIYTQHCVPTRVIVLSRGEMVHDPGSPRVLRRQINGIKPYCVTYNSHAKCSYTLRLLTRRPTGRFTNMGLSADCLCPQSQIVISYLGQTQNCVSLNLS